MWGFIICAAVLMASIVIMLALSLCKAARESDEQSCRDLAELIRKRECRGNIFPRAPVE